METIKVNYNSISRRFNINTSTTWTELESKLRSLYNIPTTTSLNVSYTDEDGDVITLSSDLEFKEVLTQQSSGRPIKLVLNTVNNSESWVFEDGNNDIVENGLSNEKVNNNLNLFEDSSYQTEVQQTTEREEENVKHTPASYYRHVSIEEEVEEEAKAEYNHSIPSLPFFNRCGGPSTYYSGSRHSDSCGRKYKGCNRSPKHQQLGTNVKNAEASTSASANNGSDKNDCNPPFTQQHLKDRLTTLHSMGFDSSNDASYEELLKRYNGNLERVIEILLRNQQFNEHDASASASIGPKGNVEKTQNRYIHEKNAEDVSEESAIMRSFPYSIFYVVISS
ncbi:2532_t:CDS:2 [Funneliformis geosporum]|uniref:12994_t:CDS:1 n=1 Tax=Funneliformis geosporum TaxID=1117311 RepID=A0A9W4SF67_9GLOM|nr:12994_t:CDS:2 [Funneliformis geosporum]CAI2178489.1 2532_t:CDS:2 [Funneliformis geosporum]